MSFACVNSWIFVFVFAIGRRTWSWIVIVKEHILLRQEIVRLGLFRFVKVGRIYENFLNYWRMICPLYFNLPVYSLIRSLSKKRKVPCDVRLMIFISYLSPNCTTRWASSNSIASISWLARFKLSWCFLEINFWSFNFVTWLLSSF